MDESKKGTGEMGELGDTKLNQNQRKHNIQLLTIIGEIEGHESAASNTKATKYEHLLPRLAQAEDDDEVDGVLILLNTMGGDVEAGLAIAEMDRFAQQTDRLSGSGRQSFHRRPNGCCGRLFLYRADRDYDRTSGALEWNVYRNHSELPEYGEDSGSDHRLYLQTFQHFPETAGRTDAEQFSACEGCGNHAGRRRCGERGDD